jgi:6-phosphofructokinase 1
MLGHVQRGGTPTAFDRVLSTRFGVAAIDLVHEGGWGQMVSLSGTEIVARPLADTVGRTKPLDMSLYHGVAEVFFS